MRNRLATRADRLGHAFLPVAATSLSSSSNRSKRRRDDDDDADNDNNQDDNNNKSTEIGESNSSNDAERWISGSRDFAPLANELCAHDAQFASSSATSTPSRAQLLDVIVRIYDEALVRTITSLFFFSI